MKTNIPTGLPASSRAAFLRLLAVFGSMFSLLASAAEPQTGAAEARSYTLFTGADFSIEQNKELHRVQDVVGTSFVINVDGKEVNVPMNRGLQRLKVVPALKLTESSASVANLKAERSYTLANDPTAQFVRALGQSELQYADAYSAQSQATAGLHSGDIVAAAENYASSRDANSGIGGGKSLTQQMANQNALLSLQRIANGPGSDFNRLASPEGGEGSFDAMDVAFDVSSRKLLDRAFMVLIVQFQTNSGKGKKAGRWVYARALQPIGPAPMKVHVEQGGFPPGYEMQSFEVHLYNRGEEVATTVAPNRSEMTPAEALQFVINGYVSSHKGATLPPAPAMGKLPADLPFKLANNQFMQTYYVRVDKDGKASDAFSDESCSHKVDDPYLQLVVRSIGFKPALENGQPVDGIAPLNLRQLPI